LDRILLNIGTEAEIEITEFIELTDPDLYEEIFNILFPQAMVVSSSFLLTSRSNSRPSLNGPGNGPEPNRWRKCRC
jgi:hypothetical protein